ncbi:MAG: hypothetical protein JJV91_01890 [Desulfosarcina sp.]|nr:hypothetical protein [Desulfobacterales bacterium]
MLELFNAYKIRQELREVQKVLNRHGILKAGFDFLYRMINLCIHFKIYRCLILRYQTLNLDLLELIPGYRLEILNFSDLLALKKRKADWIPMDKIKESFRKGDTCFKIYDLKNHLASYRWCAAHSTMVTKDLEIKFKT